MVHWWVLVHYGQEPPLLVSNPISLGVATKHYQPVPETKPRFHGTKFDISPIKYSPRTRITPKKVKLPALGHLGPRKKGSRHTGRWVTWAHVRKEVGTPVNRLPGRSPLLVSFAAFLTKVFPMR